MHMQSITSSASCSVAGKKCIYSGRIQKCSRKHCFGMQGFKIVNVFDGFEKLIEFPSAKLVCSIGDEGGAEFQLKQIA